jgi:hypothetical protein
LFWIFDFSSVRQRLTMIALPGPPNSTSDQLQPLRWKEAKR